MDDLKDCPFCGGTAHITNSSNGFRAECMNRFSGCPVNMRTHHTNSKQGAAVAWNKRYKEKANE